MNQEAQVRALLGFLPSGPSQRQASEVLFQTRMSQGKQDGQSAPLAARGGKPPLLSGPQPCSAGSVLA